MQCFGKWAREKKKKINFHPKRVLLAWNFVSNYSQIRCLICYSIHIIRQWTRTPSVSGTCVFVCVCMYLTTWCLVKMINTPLRFEFFMLQPVRACFIGCRCRVLYGAWLIHARRSFKMQSEPSESTHSFILRIIHSNLTKEPNSIRCVAEIILSAISCGDVSCKLQHT